MGKGPSLPPDNSLQVEQERIRAQQQEEERKRQEEEARKQELAQLRTNAATQGRSSAEQYFNQRGLDPSQYASTIDDQINRILSGISPEDPNPGAYFQDVGPTIWTSAEEAARNKYNRTLDQIFAPNFAEQRIPWTTDDPYLASIEAEKRQSADDIIKNMLSRGVITQSGYNAAEQNLESQAPGARSRLNEIGTNILASGQQSLRDIANNARQTASTLNLGSPFDPYSYSEQADTTFSEFINKLGDEIRAQTPGDLFSTAGLGAIAGAGQGAQNTIFDPLALAGTSSTDEETKKKNASSGVNIF